MMTIPNTVSEFSKYAAQEFLQTAVFIDDRIYGRKDGSVSESKQTSTPKGRPKALKSTDQKISSEIDGNIEENDQEEYSPRKIVTSFAKKQIICSLYQPNIREPFTEESDIFALCLAADIVIVDWDLGGGPGEKVIELVDGLIQQAVEDVPEQLRLILVYTQELNLFDIADRLYQKISESVGNAISPLDEEGGLAFHTLNSRISILGKTGRKRSAEYKNHEVQEKDLADFAVKEFAKLASGLLQATTLLGLAKIKKNSRKILSKFNSSLDPAFLTHRAMSLPDEDAVNHLVPLLISEIEAVLEDSLPKPLISNALIKDWCKNEWKPGPHIPPLLGKNADQVKIAIDFCLKGKGMGNDHKSVSLITQAIKKGEWVGDRKKIREISSILLTSEDSISNHEFSRLMSSRTFYGKHQKI
ncbi:response regulator receiver domain [Nitrosomonas sp.]|uniref:response regulator receiver domain n=1 Tax=Nitrosomonas sp. TaxID=42353 RepID=UPI002630A75D|nr:response regulator receiver domain [Nitrosomonas sp.]